MSVFSDGVLSFIMSVRVCGNYNILASESSTILLHWFSPAKTLKTDLICVAVRDASLRREIELRAAGPQAARKPNKKRRGSASTIKDVES